MANHLPAHSADLHGEHFCLQRRFCLYQSSQATYTQETYQYNFAGNLTSKAGVSYGYNDAATRPR
jgi:hypothetical protein